MDKERMSERVWCVDIGQFGRAYFKCWSREEAEAHFKEAHGTSARLNTMRIVS